MKKNQQVNRFILSMLENDYAQARKHLDNAIQEKVAARYRTELRKLKQSK
jgi:hypothetical protein